MKDPGIIKAISIDNNWDMFGRPASPGLYVQADPREQVRWAYELGANVMQTFCVSYNGYAWFPSDIAPTTPGLKGNFLQNQVDEGHKLGMKVMGYFCLGSNPYYARNKEAHEWHDMHNDLSSNEGSAVIGKKHGDYNWLPFTNGYLDYFCASIRDALLKTDIDGFMIDWFKVERGPVWLDSEKMMWQELMGEPFPACGAPSPEAEIEFKRRQVDRAWVRVKQTVEETRPSALIWTNQPFKQVNDPLWNGSRLLKEVDWLLNESPKIEFLDWLAANIGPTRSCCKTFAAGSITRLTTGATSTRNASGSTDLRRSTRAPVFHGRQMRSRRSDAMSCGRPRWIGSSQT